MASATANPQANLKQPLVHHATPLAPVRIQSIPPAYRRPQDWHRKHMDALLENDTQGVHWVLDEPNSERLLENLFPEDVLLVKSLEEGSFQDFSLQNIPALFDHLCSMKLYGPLADSPRQCGWLSLSRDSTSSEECIATFFNGLLEQVQKSIGHFIHPRSWDSFNSNTPLKGASASRKPDLLLAAVGSPNGNEADWRDVMAFGEVKSKKSTKTLKSSYVESAGKAAFILYAQDGRHAVPCIRMLGTHIYFDIFDRGGSITTAGFDIHNRPEIFLRILLGLATGSRLRLGFDSSIYVDLSLQPGEKHLRKRMTVLSEGAKVSLVLDHLIFIADGLHGRGTTVWKAFMESNLDPKGKERKRARPGTSSKKEVVVKDSWIDPLRKYTEGMILAKLRKAGVNGIPKLISEEQVTINHPSPTIRAIVNNSTHLLRSLAFSQQSPIGDHSYYLRVHSRLLTEPVGFLVTSFSCAAELLVGFIDYVNTHHEAVEKAAILHRDTSLLNLLFAKTQRPYEIKCLQHDVAESLHQKLKVSDFRRGLLADWGYATVIRRGIPGQDSNSGLPCTAEPALESISPISPSPSLDITETETVQDSDSGFPGAPRPALQPTSPVAHSPSLDAVHTETVPAEVYLGGPVVDTPTRDLTANHNIKLRMGTDRPDRDCDCDSELSDNNPLHRTGTWSWMAAELIMAGPGKPVIHTAAHDLESLFYVLLGICVLFHSPYTPKSDRELEPCFDKYFNTYSPSLLKMMIMQSKVGWLREFCNNISPYFKPLIPLLDSLRKIIILPIEDCDSESPECESPSERPHPGPVTHLQVLQELEKALASLPDECWEPKCDPKEQVVDPIVEYSLRKFRQAAAATEGVETPDAPDATNTGDHTNANPTDTDEPTTTDTEPGPAPVLEDGHLVYPRFPRPPDIRAPSGPGFEQRLFSRDDDEEYEDSDMPPSKRPRSTSSKRFSTSRHLGRRPLPVKLRNKTTSCLKERRREDNVVKGAGPAAQAGKSSTRPLPDVPDAPAPRVYMRAHTEPRYHDPHSDSDAELEALRSSSLTPNPSSESDC